MKTLRSSDHRLIRVAVLFAFAFAAVDVQGQPCAPTTTAAEDAPPGARIPSFLDSWINKYPTSTLPARMNALTGRDCNVCHHPPNLNTPGNCYRDDIAELLGLGMSIEDALNQLDGVDSDGDGVTNGEEAVTARPEAGEVGYNPGLIGDLGTDPCGTNTNQAVTGMAETPALAAIPAVSQWGFVVLSLFLVISASLVLRRRSCSG